MLSGGEMRLPLRVKAHAILQLGRNCVGESSKSREHRIGFKCDFRVEC